MGVWHAQAPWITVEDNRYNIAPVTRVLIHNIGHANESLEENIVCSDLWGSEKASRRREHLN